MKVILIAKSAAKKDKPTHLAKDRREKRNEWQVMVFVEESATDAYKS